MTELVAAEPPLIPIFGHRFLIDHGPRPVLSIMGTDVGRGAVGGFRGLSVPLEGGLSLLGEGLDAFGVVVGGEVARDRLSLQGQAEVERGA